jgi:hypothetical protein
VRDEPLDSTSPSTTDSDAIHFRPRSSTFAGGGARGRGWAAGASTPSAADLLLDHPLRALRQHLNIDCSGAISSISPRVDTVSQRAAPSKSCLRFPALLEEAKIDTAPRIDLVRVQ